jgi:hypothetical protein
MTSWQNALISLALSMVALPLFVLLYAYFGTRASSSSAASPSSTTTSRGRDRVLESHASCRIFGLVERLQNESNLPWGDVLDAGTGEHSLSWLVSLPTRSLTAVTGEPERQVELTYLARNVFRDSDAVIAGNWLDPSLLAERQFDTVIADYLLGSVEGFAPGFQTEMFARLRPLVRQRLYVIGLSPLPLTADESPGGRLLIEIGRARDMCILAAGRRPFREYEKEWARAQLERSGFAIEHITAVTSTYTRSFLRNQIAVAEFMLGKAEARLAREGYGAGAAAFAFPSRYARLYGGSTTLVSGLRAWLDELHRSVSNLPVGEFVFGTDWIIAAKPITSSSSSSAAPGVLTHGLTATPVQLSGLDF